jgi:p21-activated kinase 1
MHGMGTVHRDIKSHNVMLTVKGEVKLIDLGLVADVKHGISTMRGILGTTYWIPPGSFVVCWLLMCVERCFC